MCFMRPYTKSNQETPLVLSARLDHYSASRYNCSLTSVGCKSTDFFDLILMTATDGRRKPETWNLLLAGVVEVLTIWSDHKEFVEHSIDCKEICMGPEMAMCSVVSLTSLLQKLHLNKAPGPDLFLQSSCCMQVNLYAFFSMYCLMYALFTVLYLIPVLNTTIVPICKNKNGNTTETSNYRPVAVATVVSKLLEHFILFSISPFLGSTGNQFGCKTGHGTDQCTFLLKQSASCSASSPMVHQCMLFS